MTFAYPYFFFLPVLYLLLALSNRSKTLAIACADVNTLGESPRSLRTILYSPLNILFSTVFVLALTIALARPQEIAPLPREMQAHDIMLAIDISGSMGTRDISRGMRAISRLDAVKSVVKEFIENRKDDRIGLAVFSSTGFLQAPLTLDHNIIIQLLGHLQPGVGGDGTAIGDGLGLALKSIQTTAAKSAAIVLLTDGVNNSGQVEPLQAANVARDLMVKVHTIGIGSARPEFGLEYDEQTLKQIAEKSGGVFFHASNFDGLKQVYQQIDLLEKRAQDEGPKLVANEMYVGFAKVALIVSLLGCLVFNTILMRVP